MSSNVNAGIQWGKLYVTHFRNMLETTVTVLGPSLLVVLFGIAMVFGEGVADFASLAFTFLFIGGFLVSMRCLQMEWNIDDVEWKVSGLEAKMA